MWLHKEENFADTRDRLEKEGFAVKPFNIAGEECWLIFPPHMGVEWSKDNMIYRSSIWNSQGYPVSLSWKKFFNWDEQCELAPKPTSLNDCELIDKIDGSTLLVSMYKGQLIMRTRGSHTLEQLDNGFEKDVLLEKYGEFFSSLMQIHVTDCTFVFEWVTPTNKIVLDYGNEPKLFLTGIINHADYKYVPQLILDQTAAWFNFERPKTYKFETITDLQKAMQEMKGIEGVCVYFNGGNDIKKVKTDEYLMLHSVKFKLGYKALIDMIYEENKCEEEFKAYIEKRFDHEGLTFVESLIEQIYLADYTIRASIDHAYTMIMMQNEPQDKKAFAAVVMSKDYAYKQYSGFLFKLYESDDANLRQLLMSQKGLRDKFKKMILDVVTK